MLQKDAERNGKQSRPWSYCWEESDLGLHCLPRLFCVKYLWWPKKNITFSFHSLLYASFYSQNIPPYLGNWELCLEYQSASGSGRPLVTSQNWLSGISQTGKQIIKLNFVTSASGQNITASQITWIFKLSVDLFMKTELLMMKKHSSLLRILSS